MNPTLARIPVPFRWNVHDGLNGASLIARAYSSEVAGVLTRTSPKRVSDRNGLLVPLVQGIPPIGWVGGEAGLLLERAGTNLCLRSEEFDNASWVKTGVTVTANAITAPNGTLTADVLTTDATSGRIVFQTIGFTGDGEKGVAVYLRAGTAGVTQLSLFDDTAATHRHRILVTWTAGVPALTTLSGAGTSYAVEPLGTMGWYRILFSGTGIVAANSNRLLIYPNGAAATAVETVHAWGAQASDAAVPSSYIPTTTVAVTRNADTLYFPFTLAPTAMTVFVRGVEMAPSLGVAGEPRLWQIGSAADGDSRFGVYKDTSSRYVAFHDPATFVASTAATVITRGQRTEVRAALSALGAATTGVSVNGGAEVTATGAAQPLAVAWSDTRLYLNSVGAIAHSAYAYTHVCVALGEQPLDVMRELAGV